MTKNYTKNFLKDYANASGHTMEDMAQTLGLTMPSVWRYANNQRKLNIDTALQLWENFGFPAEDVGRLFTIPPDPAYFAKHGVAWKGQEPKEPPLQPVKLYSMKVIGQVQAGKFTTALEWPLDEQYNVDIPITDGFGRNVTRYGFICKGDSMDKVFPDGSVLVTIPIDKIGREPKTGDYVIVQRRDSHSDNFEATVKALQICKDGTYVFWPQSTDYQFRPIAIPPQFEPDDAGAPNIRILALVTGSLSVPPKPVF